jgi:hypothetical protein
VISSADFAAENLRVKLAQPEFVEQKQTEATNNTLRALPAAGNGGVKDGLCSLRFLLLN